MLRSRGLTLIEVLAAVMILSIGVVVYGALQTRAMGTAMNANKAQIADSILVSLADKIRINSTNQSTLSKRQQILNEYLSYNWNAKENCLVMPQAIKACSYILGNSARCDSSKMVMFDAYTSKCSSNSLLKETSLAARQCPSSENICLYYAWDGAAANDIVCDDVNSTCTVLEVFVK